MATKKKKSLWTIPGLEDRAKELIKSGALVKEGTIGLCKILNQDLAEAISESGLKLTVKAVELHVPQLIWDKTALDALERVVSSELPLAKFAEYHPYIPKDIIQRQARKLTG